MDGKALINRGSTRRLSSAIVLVAALAAMVPATVLAQGEPKNEAPFTRPVGTVSQSSRDLTTSGAVGRGEAKNQAPFTRRVGNVAIRSSRDLTTSGPVGQGEAKNELPFTYPVAAASSSGSGFSWIDAGLGLALGISLCVAAMGSTLLVRHKAPRTA